MARGGPLLAVIVAVKGEAHLTVVHGDFGDVVDLAAGRTDKLSLDTFRARSEHLQPPGVAPVVPLHRNVPSAVELLVFVRASEARKGEDNGPQQTHLRLIYHTSGSWLPVVATIAYRDAWPVPSRSH